MEVARDPALQAGGAVPLERTDGAIAALGEVLDRGAVMDGAGGPQSTFVLAAAAAAAPLPLNKSAAPGGLVLGRRTSHCDTAGSGYPEYCSSST
jgi:hypothetical protein